MPPARRTVLRNCQQGIGLIEFAIALPILISLAVGLFSFGTVIRELTVVSDATKHAARAGARRSGDLNLLCESPNSSATITCPEIQVLMSALNPDTPLDVVAKSAACSYLDNAGLHEQNWLVSAIVRTRTEERISRQVLTVHISRTQSPTNEIAWNLSEIIKNLAAQATPGTGLHAQHSFLLEGACR